MKYNKKNEKFIVVTKFTINEGAPFFFRVSAGCSSDPQEIISASFLAGKLRECFSECLKVVFSRSDSTQSLMQGG